MKEVEEEKSNHLPSMILVELKNHKKGGAMSKMVTRYIEQL